MLIEKNTFK